MSETWERNEKFILETTQSLLKGQEKINDRLSQITTDIAVIKVQFFLIGCVASMLGGGIVSVVLMFYGPHR